MPSKKKDKSKKNKNASVKDYVDDNNDNKNISKNQDQIRSLSTIDYIQATVQKDVQQGLLKLARERPKNPIEFLGKFLLDRSKKKK